ncbi:MAG: hypothetical protein HDQ98_01600 [Lachnospiraceae bacterium]|nr:hypothetical protein [Lachnospiraceae bacterium]
MNNVIKIMKMDMAICRKSWIIMILSMLAAGIGCLFFLTPLLLGFFVVGSTAVISSIFAVEGKSNMEFFYGCFPIRKREHIIGRSLTCLVVMAVPTLISIVFVLIGMHIPLCQMEEMRILTETTKPYQMIILCAMIMLGFWGGGNLLLAAFIGKIESREMCEVLLLLLEALLMGAVLFVVQKACYHGDQQAMMSALGRFASDHQALACILLVLTGLAALAAGTMISMKLVQKKRG